MKISINAIHKVVRASKTTLYKLCNEGKLKCFKDEDGVLSIDICDVVKLIIERLGNSNASMVSLLKLAEVMIKRYEFIGAGIAVIVDILEDGKPLLQIDEIIHGIDSSVITCLAPKCVDVAMKMIPDARVLKFIVVADEKKGESIYIPISWR